MSKDTSYFDSFVGTVLGRDYRLERLVAAGGVGGVFEATHLRLPNKRYAVKILNQQNQDERIMHRFRREADIACRLAHPNIIEVFDFNYTEEGAPYLVMEYLEGVDLKQAFKNGLKLSSFVYILNGVCAGLSAAHQQNVVHRDIKPTNIFLVTTEDEKHPIVKLIDFGISKIRGSQSLVTMSDSIIGTLYYMSPEQAMGRVEEIDHRTDIFALGAMSFQALTGRLPFKGKSFAQTITAICHNDPNYALLPFPAFEKCLRCALAKNKDERYSNVEDFAREFTLIAENQNNLTPAPQLNSRQYERTEHLADLQTAPQRTPVPQLESSPVQEDPLPTISYKNPQKSEPASSPTTIEYEPKSSRSERHFRMKLIAVGIISLLVIGALILGFILGGIHSAS